MDFAKSELTKYGWQEGKGLGASETGIKEALKVKLKFDSAGLGHDRAEEFTFHWWDHVYNKVASNLEIKKDKAGTVVLEQKEETKISKKKPSVLSKQIVYGNFVKGGTLHGSDIAQKESSSVSDGDEEELNKDLSLKLTDDELFKICGGRTAHKAARHGLKMTAKLSRVEAQEQLYLQKWGDSKETSLGLKEEMKKKDKEVYEKTVDSTFVNDEKGSHKVEQDYLQKSGNLQTPPAGVDIVKKKKKKKKERDLCDEELTSENGGITPKEHSFQEFRISETIALKKEKKKKKKDCRSREKEIPNGDEPNLVQQDFQNGRDSVEPDHNMKKKKKKKKKEEQIISCNGEVDFENGNTTEGLCTHEEKGVELGEQEDICKKIKKKRKMCEDKVAIEEDVPRKKRKKKYEQMEEGYETGVKQDLNVDMDTSTSLNWGMNFKDEERNDSGEIPIKSKKKKKTVENGDCTKVPGNEKLDTNIVTKINKKEQLSNTLDEFHKSNENGTVEIESMKKKKKKKKTLSDITIDKEEESKVVYEFEEACVRSDAGEGSKKKKTKNKSDVAEAKAVTDSPRKSCMKKKKKKKEKEKDDETVS
ncbi:uncharacterized protein LOC143036475 [Oratosquilla oratoria]|uniref:uncharacterized protein LOC143036475 n=1 Tax=Oratosquilla oratoria TaxID=337810 RepID=UPI003F772404